MSLPDSPPFWLVVVKPDENISTAWAYAELDAYPDVRPTLEGLRAKGTRTAILSNGSKAMLAQAIAQGDLQPFLEKTK